MTDRNGAETLILGCGNTLFGDDGFGPALAADLAGCTGLPARAVAVDAGTGAGDILFDLMLDPGAVRRVIIIDALPGKTAEQGGLSFIPPHDLPREKAEGFSPHGRPSINLLTELAEATGLTVEVLAARVEPLPEEVAPGLSDKAKALIPTARRELLRHLQGRGEA